MKRIVLLIMLLRIYGIEAQAPAGQVIPDQNLTPSNNKPLQMNTHGSGQGITNNVCDSLNAGFVAYPVNGLVEQFTNESSVLGGSISGWVWSFGDGVVTKDTFNPNPTHNYASPGTYTVCLTVYENVQGSGINCQDSICKSVIISYYAGVQDLSDNEISIYPNPSTGYLIVRANVPVESYSIYNTVGEKLDEQKSNGNIIYLPSTMKNGIYFIYFKTATATLIKKVLLQNQ